MAGETPLLAVVTSVSLPTLAPTTSPHLYCSTGRKYIYMLNRYNTIWQENLAICWHLAGINLAITVKERHSTNNTHNLVGFILAVSKQNRLFAKYKPRSIIPTIRYIHVCTCTFVHVYTLYLVHTCTVYH